MKNLCITILTVLFFVAIPVKASDFPKFPIKSTPNTNSGNSTLYNNNNYYNKYGNYYYNNNCYHCIHNCYSTTLTTKELRALSKERKKANLERRCKEHKIKSSKCQEFLKEENQYD